MNKRISEDDYRLFFNIGRNLLSDDFFYQKKTVMQASDELEKKIAGLKSEYRKKKKAVMVSCICASALTVILLL